MTTTPRGLTGAAFAVGILCFACSKPAVDAPDAAVAPAVSKPSTATAKASNTATKRSSSPTAKATAAQAPKDVPTDSSTAATGTAIAKAADGDLKVEEPEANPYSETVTLRLSVTPQVKGLVMWGGKQVAKLGPGSMEAEIVRPRGSGPVDLEIKADGYMPYHTRLYSDRNEKVGARLYRSEEAPGMFGYKRSTNPTEKK